MPRTAAKSLKVTPAAPVKRGPGRPSKKAAAAPVAAPVIAPTHAKFRVELPIEMAERVTALAFKRGTTINDLVRLSLTNLARYETIYHLNTKLTFGKYTGETMETVIRCDTRYATWLIANVERVHMGDDCLELIDMLAVIDEAQNHH